MEGISTDVLGLSLLFGVVTFFTIYYFGMYVGDRFSHFERVHEDQLNQHQQEHMEGVRRRRNQEPNIGAEVNPESE